MSIIAQPAGDMVRVEIRDNGEGMSDETRKKLFQPLYTTRSRGIGLGLAVSKKYVEANSGTISFESIQGEGTSFTLVLPVGK